MPLLAIATVAALVTSAKVLVVTPEPSTAHAQRPSYFHARKRQHVVPLDSTLHEGSVLRTIAKGLHARDPDFLVVALQSLSKALEVHHGHTHVPADVLLDALVPMIGRHCRLDRVRTAAEAASVGVSPGSEQAYACCVVDSAAAYAGRVEG